MAGHVDAAVMAGDLEHLGNRSVAAGALADDGRAAAGGAELLHLLAEVGRGGIERIVCAELEGDLAAACQRVNHDRRGICHLAGHQSAETDRAAAKDQRGIGRIDVAAVAPDAEVADGERLNPRAVHVVPVVGDLVQVALAADQVFAVAARGVGAEADFLEIEARGGHHAGLAVFADAAGDHAVRGDLVAGLQGLDALADLHHVARPLVAGNERLNVIAAFLGLAFIDLNVGAADAAGAHADQRLVVLELGKLNLGHSQIKRPVKKRLLTLHSRYSSNIFWL